MNNITSIEITKKEAIPLIYETKGLIFSCVFIKRTTGETRKMICRLHVKKGVKGIGLKYNPMEKGLLNVFDMKKGEFRMINLETLKELKINHVTYKITE